MSLNDEINSVNVLIVGASQGIGFGFVKRLLQDDKIAKVFATSRQLELATDLIALVDEHSGRLICLEMDITDELQIVETIHKIHTQVDKLHLVVNCVGLLHEDTLQPEKA